MDPDLDLEAENITEGPCAPVSVIVEDVDEGEEAGVVDAGVVEDFTPFFEDWDADKANEVTEITVGEQVEYLIPEAFDCCDNEVEVTVVMRGISDFATWLRGRSHIVFNPSRETRSGLYRVQLNLDNGIKTAHYFLNIYVSPYSNTTETVEDESTVSTTVVISQNSTETSTSMLENE